MGDHNHCWAVTHISSYTYDTSTVALSNSVPHVPIFLGVGWAFHDKIQPYKRKPSIPPSSGTTSELFFLKY